MGKPRKWYRRGMFPKPKKFRSDVAKYIRGGKSKRKSTGWFF